MSLLGNAHLAIVQCEFEHRDAVAFHELGGNRAAYHVGKLRGATCEVLSCLHNGMGVRATFRLNWNNEVSTGSIHPYVYLVDLDLAQPLDRRPKVVLKAVRGQAEEDIN